MDSSSSEPRRLGWLEGWQECVDEIERLSLEESTEEFQLRKLESTENKPQDLSDMPDMDAD